MGSTGDYSIPKEAQLLLEEGIIKNPLVSLPPELANLTKHVAFEGSAKPSVPINWRFAESIASLKGFEATMLNLLLTRKYGIEPVDVVINTDHATLFIMSMFLTQVIKDGKPTPFNIMSPDTKQLFPDRDLHNLNGSLHRSLASNIYKTKDGRFYHTHTSMNPVPTLTALGLPLDDDSGDTIDTVVQKIQDTVSKHDAASLDHLMNEDYLQAGTIAYSTEEFFATEQGKATERVGLYEIFKEPESSHPASWWRDNEGLRASPKRPLAGLKIVDLTRVIAGPTIARGLAEQGASVMRIVSPHITDLCPLHQDLNWGKWNAHLHLKNQEDKEKLRTLILDADVVIDGYRPGVMERFGFGRSDIFNLVKDRSYGIIHLRENCYGWYGPWSHRSGWQQISDACCGISTSFAQAMGHQEAVTPVFPNSDFCTGVIGTTAILEALIKRAESGGSYGVDVSLNYYSQWLARTVGTYPQDIWTELWNRHESPSFRHFHGMLHTLPRTLGLLKQHDSDSLLKPEFFEPRESKAVGTTFIQVKPIAQFPNGEVELGYNIGTRGNGVDDPVWPEDLSVEFAKTIKTQ